MESLSSKKKHGAGKSRRNLKVKNADDILSNKSVHEANVELFFAKNRIIGVDDESDHDLSFHNQSSRINLFHNASNLNFHSNIDINFISTTQNGKTESSKRNNGMKMASCKPCSVILERLSKEELRHITTKKILSTTNVVEDHQTGQHSTSNNRVGTLRRRKNGTYKKQSVPRNSVEKKPAGKVNQRRRSGAGGRSFAVKTLESDLESHTSYPDEINDDLQPFPYDEKFDFNNSNNLKTSEKLSTSKTPEIKDVIDSEGGRTSPIISKSKISSAKRFNLSLKKKTWNEQENGVPQSKILATETLKELKNGAITKTIHSEDPKHDSSPSKKLNTTIKAMVLNVRGAKTRRQESTRHEDKNLSKSSKLTPEISDSVSPKPLQHFSPSPSKEKIDTEDHAAHTQKSRNDISADSDQISKSIPSQLNHRERKLKRKLVNSNDGEAVAAKLKKSEENCEEEGQLDSHSPEDGVSRLGRLKISTSIFSKSKSTPKVSNGVSKNKDVRISPVKFEGTGNSSTSKQAENVRSLDASEADVSETKPTDSGSNSPNKSRSTKITDYFSKIDKALNVSQGSSTKNLDQKSNDSVLKKKYGIFKDVIISLVDYKQPKNSGSKYSALRIEKTTQKPSNTSNDSHSTATTENVTLASSSVTPSRNLESSFNSVSTNTAQSLADVTNLSVVHNRVDELCDDSSNTRTVPLTMTLSPIGQKSSSAKKNSQIKNQKHSMNIQVSERRRTLRARTEQQLANVTNDINFYVVHKDLGEDEEVAEKNTSELERNSPISSTIVNECHTHSLEPQGKNDTPKSLETLNSEVGSTQTPKKQRHLVTDNIVSDESEVRKESNDTSPRISEVPAKDDVLKNLPNGNEPSDEIINSLVVDKDSDAVIDQAATDEPGFVLVKKSPIEMKVLKPNPVNRHFPVDSMTFLSYEMLKENDSWMELNENFENVADTIETTAANESPNTIPENESVEDKTTVFKKIADNVDSSCFPSSNIKVTTENEEVESLNEDARCHGEISTKDSAVSKLRSSKRSGNLKPVLSVDVQTGSSPKKTRSSTAEKKVEDTLHSERLSKINATEFSAPNSEPILPVVQTPVVRNPVMTVVQVNENPNSGGEDLADLRQDDELFIDTDDSDSESQLVEGATPGKLSKSCSTNSTTLQEEEEEDKKKEGAGTKNKEQSQAECVICKKSYKNAYSLEQHLKTHVDCTKKACILCDKPVTHTNAIKHYLEHCSCLEIGRQEYNTCGICDLKFRTKKAMAYHLKSSHNVGKKGRKVRKGLNNVHSNRCDVCSLSCNSEEDLFEHLYTHTPKDLQDAFQNAQAKQQSKSESITTKNNQNQGSENQSSESKSTKNKKQSPSPLIQKFGISICNCHKDERLEISGGVIIELAPACVQCKTFFKYRKCLKNHFASTSCKWNSENVVRPKMFCNKCSVILDTWPDLLNHLKGHTKEDVNTKTSFLCKRCNICFFGIGSLFQQHWLSHCEDSTFAANHASFSKNMKVKIVESEGPEFVEDGEPTESLFIPEHQCAKCDKLFQTDIEIDKHTNTSGLCSEKLNPVSLVNEDPKTMFKLVCSICKKEFIDKSTFDTHIKDFLHEHDPIKDFLPVPKCSDTASGNNQITCGICKIEYETAVSYKNHLISHEVIQENFYCNYCTLMMDSVEEFERHSVEHKGSPEKPVVCKVVFAKATFHCKPCRTRFDSQSALDEHLATHDKSIETSPKPVANIICPVRPVIDKKILTSGTEPQDLNKVQLDAPVSTPVENLSDLPKMNPSVIKVNPSVIHLSDDSNSNDVEIIPEEKNHQIEEPVTANTLMQQEEQKMNTQETKKPAFLRVKNLKELLPYACNKCKAEFDTQINLSKHVCNQQIIPAPNLTCALCSIHQSNNESDSIRHVLSHFPSRTIPQLNDSWTQAVPLASGQTVLKCNFCAKFGCLSMPTMQLHFRIQHSNIYRLKFKCRVCSSFDTELEQDIDRHEAFHFLSRSPPTSNLSQIQPADSSKTLLPRGIWIPPVDTSSPQLANVSNSSSQTVSTSSWINLDDNLVPNQQANNSNNVQQPGRTASTTRNLLPLIEEIKDLIKSRQLGVTNQLHNNPNNFQQSASNPPAVSSGCNSASIQPMKNVNNSQLRVQTLPSGNNTNNLQETNSMPTVTSSASIVPQSQSVNSSNFQQSIPISSANTSGNNYSMLQALTNLNNPQQSKNNSNDFQSSTQIPPLTTSASSNVTSMNFNDSQQLGSTVQRDGNNSNNFLQSISIPPVTSSANNLSAIQPTAQTFQIQINTNSVPFNNMTNVVHTVPVYIAKLIYTCSICKNFQCSSEQELQTHENLHDMIRYDETPKRFFRCKVCTNILCPSEEHLKAHMASYHNGDKSKSQNQAPNNTATSNQIKCKHCIQTFTSSAQLAEHVNTYHTILNQGPQFKHVYPYTCQICSIGFLNETFLHAHNRQIHPNFKLMHKKKASNHNVLYKCETCGLLLISQETLNYHMKSHDVGFQ